MQTVWSRAARPQISCRCISCISPLPSVLARRTASATTRRRLTLTDAFTVLLAPVLATAFIADTTRKDRRRKEWERRIAEIEGETEIIRLREKQIWDSRRPGMKWHQNLALHKRPYSTSALSVPVEENLEDELEPPQWNETDSLAEETELSAEFQDNGLETQHAEQFPGELVETTEDLDDETAKAAKRVDRLVTIKLAIRMIMHIHLGNDPRYIDIDPNHCYSSDGLPQDLNELLSKLKQVKQTLSSLKALERPDLLILRRPSTKPPSTVLDQDVKELANMFRAGDMAVPELVQYFSETVLHSSESPSNRGYTFLLHALEHFGHKDLAYMVVEAMDEGRVVLSQRAIFAIIWHYGQNRDADRFELFLRDLTKRSTQTTNRNAYLKVGEPWHWIISNDTQVPVPRSCQPHLLQMLIYTSLKCNQPHRAEAWASILGNNQADGIWTSHVLRNFLKYYCHIRNWRQGKRWLSIAREWAVPLALHGMRHLQRVVFSMLELCVVCEKQELYAEILQAAVDTRLGAYESEPGVHNPRAYSILAEWADWDASIPACEADSYSPEEKARAFYERLGQYSKQHADGILEPAFHWPIPQTLKWQELCRNQQTELEKLKAELDEANSLIAKVTMQKAFDKTTRPAVPDPKVGKRSVAHSQRLRALARNSKQDIKSTKDSPTRNQETERGTHIEKSENFPAPTHPPRVRKIIPALEPQSKSQRANPQQLLARQLEAPQQKAPQETALQQKGPQRKAQKPKTQEAKLEPTKAQQPEARQPTTPQPKPPQPKAEPAVVDSCRSPTPTPSSSVSPDFEEMAPTSKPTISVHFSNNGDANYAEHTSLSSSSAQSATPPSLVHHVPQFTPEGGHFDWPRTWVARRFKESMAANKPFEKKIRKIGGPLQQYNRVRCDDLGRWLSAQDPRLSEYKASVRAI